MAHLFRKNARVTLSSCCLAHAIQDGLSASVYVLLPILAQTFGLDLGVVGLFKGVKSLIQGLLEIISGIASERFGDRDLLVFGLGMSGAGYMLFMLADGATLVLVCLAIVGVGGAFQHAPASALVSSTYEARRRRGALGLYNSSGDAGKLLFTASFGVAIGAGVAWSFVTLAFGAAAIAAGAWVLFTLKARATSRQIDGRPPAPGDGAANDDAGKWGIRDARGFCALLATVFLDSLVQASALTFAAFLMLAKGAPLSAATFAATAILVGGMLGKAACGFVAERLGIRSAFVVAQLLTGLGLVGAVLAPTAAAYVLLPLLGVVLQGSTSITYGMVNDFVRPQKASRGFALVYAASSFSSVAGPVGFGIVGDHYGVEAAMIAMAGFAVLAIAPFVLFGLGPPSRAGAARNPPNAPAK